MADALAWSAPRPTWRSLPPMGQGLAVIALLLAVGLVSLAATTGYLAAYRIAKERTAIARLDRQIATRRAEVAALRRQYMIRSRFNQLDRWRTQLDLAPIELGQTAARADLHAVAEAREAEVARRDDEARPIDAPRHAGYPRTARTDLDQLIGSLGGG